MSREKTFLRLNLIFILLFIGTSHVNAQPLFQVERESFCKAVHGRQPIKPFSGVAEIKKGEPLFLWMEIKGDKRALTMLEAKGQMPIYHAWALDYVVIEKIDIGIKDKEWADRAEAIKAQVRKQGFFTWRTQSLKRNLKAGNWYVSVLDANRKPTPKCGSGSEACRPEIIVRFSK